MTTVRLMRTLLPSSLSRSQNAVNRAVVNTTSVSKAVSCTDPHSCLTNCRCFAQVIDNDRWNRDIWFNSSAPRLQSLRASEGYSFPEHPRKTSQRQVLQPVGKCCFNGSVRRDDLPMREDAVQTTPTLPGGDHKPPDERTIQLGKTVRILHERLPTLLKEPLPSEILSPSISLHLFPSTHPHLPTVSGRLAYIAALWTAPVAWGRMPLIGNVRLIITHEKMVRNGGSAVPLAQRDEKLVVKWKTCGKSVKQRRDGTGGIYRGMGLAAVRDPVDKIRGFIGGTKSGEHGANEEEEFCGIFIFEFDEKGRIAKHTIEHTEEGGRWDRMTRMVSVTDWLLGQFGRKKEEHPALAWCEERPSAGLIRLMDRRPRD